MQPRCEAPIGALVTECKLGLTRSYVKQQVGSVTKNAQTKGWEYGSLDRRLDFNESHKRVHLPLAILQRSNNHYTFTSCCGGCTFFQQFLKICNKRYTCKPFVEVEESVIHTELQSTEAQNECALCTRASSPSKLETKGQERTYTEEMMGYSLAAIDMVHLRVIKSSGTVIMCPQR